MNFYVTNNGQRMGPYPVEQIRTFLQQGLVQKTDHVWVEGWSSWLPIDQVPGLAPTEAATAEAPGAEGHSVPIRSSAPSNQFSSEQIYARDKNPTLACVLSLLVVGAGQFYNGDWGKGAFLLITCVLATIFSFGMLWIFWALMSAVDAYMVASCKRPLRGSFFKF